MEHVGPKNHRDMMEVIDRCLVDDGVALVHTIANNKSLRHGTPWIEKYIFPNAVAPSLAQIGRAMEGLFVLEDLHNIGPDYDPTLMAWWENFDRTYSEISHRYDRKFYLMWKFYLLAAAGAARARDGQLYQIVMTKTGPRRGQVHGADLREQVVLDLVVEADEEERDDARQLEVARGLELVDPVVVLAVGDRQAHVRRREHEREADADAGPDRRVDREADERPPDQRRDHEPRGVVRDEAGDLDPPRAVAAVLLRPAIEVHERRAAHAERHQRRHRPEHPALQVALEPARLRPALLVIAARRRERERPDVRIDALDVRVAVVQPIVLLAPVQRESSSRRTAGTRSTRRTRCDRRTSRSCDGCPRDRTSRSRSTAPFDSFSQ